MSFLEKIKEEQIIAYHNLKIDFEEVVKNYENMKHEYSIISDQNAYLAQENSELKQFVQRNQEKIIKYDNLFLDLKSTGSINEQLKNEIERINNDHNVNIMKIKETYSNELNSIRQQHNSFNQKIRNYEMKIEEKNLEIEKLKKVISTVQNLNKKSFIGVNYSPNKFQTLPVQHGQQRTYSNENIERNQSSKTHNQFTNNLHHKNPSKNSNDILTKDLPSNIESGPNSNFLSAINSNLVSNDQLHNNLKNYYKDQNKNNTRSPPENFTLRPNSENHNFIKNSNNRQYVKNDVKKETFTGEILNYNYDNNENSHKKNYSNDNISIINNQILENKVNLENKFNPNILSFQNKEDFFRPEKNFSTQNFEENYINSTSYINISPNNASHLLDNQIEEISSRIKDTERLINDLNIKFTSIDKGNMKEVNELMERIEAESVNLIKYKCLFNNVFREMTKDIIS